MARDGRPAKAILLTHNETSTGVENPLAELSRAVRDASPDTLILVDGISGLGAVPFRADEWGLDVVVTGSQKSWMAPPGVAMISVSERAWTAAAAATMPRFYFDLLKARKSLGGGETPWTPAVGVLFALDEALQILEEEGAEQIFARHEACARAARSGLEALGFTLFADPANASRTVTAAWVPDGVEWSALNREMRSRGLVLAGGQDRLSGKIMRIGHLGDVTVEAVVSAIEVVGQALEAVRAAGGVGRAAVASGA
jgi:aspartate aminotransferase-like enzyme